MSAGRSWGKGDTSVFDYGSNITLKRIINIPAHS
jgi:hypothetical protein